MPTSVGNGIGWNRDPGPGMRNPRMRPVLGWVFWNFRDLGRDQDEFEKNGMGLGCAFRYRYPGIIPDLFLIAKNWEKYDSSINGIPVPSRDSDFHPGIIIPILNSDSRPGIKTIGRDSHPVPVPNPVWVSKTSSEALLTSSIKRRQIGRCRSNRARIRLARKIAPTSRRPRAPSSSHPQPTFRQDIFTINFN